MGICYIYGNTKKFNKNQRICEEVYIIGVGTISKYHNAAVYRNEETIYALNKKKRNRFYLLMCTYRISSLVISWENYRNPNQTKSLLYNEISRML